jgi:mono/diheme cytochrome c family protein
MPLPLPSLTRICLPWLLTLSLFSVGALADDAVAAGEKLFNTKCRDCHALDKRRVGPALAGATERRSREWLTHWLQDPVAMVKSDAVAGQLMAVYKTQMPKLDLTRDEIAQLLAWLASHPAP